LVAADALRPGELTAERTSAVGTNKLCDEAVEQPINEPVKAAMQSAVFMG
jgi:hypothetical protein